MRETDGEQRISDMPHCDISAEIPGTHFGFHCSYRRVDDKYSIHVGVSPYISTMCLDD